MALTFWQYETIAGMVSNYLRYIDASINPLDYAIDGLSMGNNHYRNMASNELDFIEVVLNTFV